MRSLRRAPSATAGAGAGERERRRLSDPGRGAGDRHRLAAQLRHAAADASRRRARARRRAPRASSRRSKVSSIPARSSTCRTPPLGAAAARAPRSSRARKARARSSACSPVESTNVELAEVEHEHADAPPHGELDGLGEVRRGRRVELAAEREAARAADPGLADGESWRVHRGHGRHRRHARGPATSARVGRPTYARGRRERVETAAWATRPSRSSTPIRSSPTSSTRADLERAQRGALARVQRLAPGTWDAAAALERDSHHRGFLVDRRAARARGRRARPPLSSS